MPSAAAGTAATGGSNEGNGRKEGRRFCMELVEMLSQLANASRMACRLYPAASLIRQPEKQVS